MSLRLPGSFRSERCPLVMQRILTAGAPDGLFDRSLNTHPPKSAFSSVQTNRSKAGKAVSKVRVVEAFLTCPTRDMLTAFAIVVGCLIAAVFILLRKR